MQNKRARTTYSYELLYSILFIAIFYVELSVGMAILIFNSLFIFFDSESRFEDIYFTFSDFSMWKQHLEISLEIFIF